MNQFLASMNNAHEQCLAANNKTSKPLAETNNGICSQPACQRYHDYVFGSRAASDRQLVTTCFAEVNQYQVRKAADQQRREEEERERTAQREKQRQQEEADRARRAAERAAWEADRAKRAAERAAWEAREEKRKQAELQKDREIEARLKAARDEAARQEIIRERDNELARIARERTDDVAPALLPAGIASEPDTVPQSNNDISIQVSSPEPGMEVRALIKKNPFGEGKGAEIKAGFNPDDPSTWPSPFSAHKDDPDREQAIGMAGKAFETAFSKAGDVLADDIRRAEATLSSAKAAAYIRDTEDVRSAMKGLERVFRYYDEAVNLVKIAKAETPDDRARATWELGIKLTQDAAKGGAMWVVGMLPKGAANVIGGPVSWAGSVVFSSEKTAVEPSDVLQRPQTFSLEEKKEVLYRQAQAFDKYQSAWSRSQRDELARLSVLVLQEMAQH
jgi:hypothetical protein